MLNFLKKYWQQILIVLVILSIELPLLWTTWSLLDDGESIRHSIEITNALKNGEWDKFIKLFINVENGLYGLCQSGFWLPIWLQYLLFGVNPFYFRLVRLLVFIGTGLFIYGTTKKLSDSKTAGFISAISFIFFLPNILNWYQLGKVDAQVALYYAFSFYFLVKAYQSDANKKIYYTLLSVVPLVLIYHSKTTTLMMIPISFFMFLLTFINKDWKNNRKIFVIYFIANIVCFLTVLTPGLILGIMKFKGYASDYSLSLPDMQKNFMAYITSIRLNFGLLIIISLSTFIIRSIYNLFRYKSLNDTLVWEILMIAFVITGLVVQSPWKHVMGRYLLPYSIGLYVLIGIELNNLLKILWHTSLDKMLKTGETSMKQSKTQNTLADLSFKLIPNKTLIILSTITGASFIILALTIDIIKGAEHWNLGHKKLTLLGIGIFLICFNWIQKILPVFSHTNLTKCYFTFWKCISASVNFALKTSKLLFSFRSVKIIYVVFCKTICIAIILVMFIFVFDNSFPIYGQINFIYNRENATGLMIKTIAEKTPKNGNFYLNLKDDMEIFYELGLHTHLLYKRPDITVRFLDLTSSQCYSNGDTILTWPTFSKYDIKLLKERFKDNIIEQGSLLMVSSETKTSFETILKKGIKEGIKKEEGKHDHRIYQFNTKKEQLETETYFSSNITSEGFGDNRYVGQVFTAQSDKLHSFKFIPRLSLQAYNSTTPIHIKMFYGTPYKGRQIANYKISDIRSFYYITVDNYLKLYSPIPLIKGKEYTVLFYTEAKKKDEFEIVVNNADTYKDGYLIVSNDYGKTWDKISDKDMQFETNYNQ